MPSPVATLRSLRHGPLKLFDPLWLALGRAYRALLRWHPRPGPTLQQIGPYGPFRMNPTFAFSDFAHWGDRHNRGFAACVEACRGKTCVLDVGAHIGLVSLPISGLLAPGGRLYAFEPATANHRLLAEHLALNGIDNVEVIDALVGAEDSSAVPFYEQREATGVNSVVGGGSRSGFERTRRRQVSLDSFCHARRLSPEVIKIDVEGAEMAVLEGGREVIGRCRPVIFLSVHPAHLEALGHDQAALAALIDSLGYRCRDMDGQTPGRFRLDEYRLDPASPGATG